MTKYKSILTEAFPHWTKSPEQEQGILRVFISISFLCYLLLISPEGETVSKNWETGIVIITGFLLYSLVLLISTLIYPQYAVTQRVISICVDIFVFSYGLHVTGPLSAPWFGVYLWVTLGNGFRYGEKYLYISATASLIGFACVTTMTPYWETHEGLAIGLACTLLLIPAYSALLIRRLNEARNRADDASRAKSDFLSCMSHEIRTPLNGILGMTDLLKLRPLNPQDRECVETIHASGHALARQINEILDLSKIEAGHLSLEQIKFDLYVLVNTTLRIFQPQIEDKHLQIQEIIDPKTPFLVTGDPHKLQQIVINLVGNAIKFTENGMISVRIYPRSIETHQVMLRFEVSDTGTGIPADKQQDIFEPFTQADNSISRNFGGTGLGTTICKNLVELMGGKIGVHSTPGVGTTFWFDIPFAHEDQVHTEPGQPWIQQCRALYLNPDEEAQSIIPAKLKGWGMPHDSVPSLEQANRLLSSETNYAALIIENMTHNSELADIISGNITTIPIGTKVIIVKSGSHLIEEDDGNRDDLFILEPPLQNNILLNVLHACQSRHSTEEDVLDFSRKQISTQQTSKQLRILVGDDSATNRLVLQRMLEQLGHKFTIVQGGEAVLSSLEENYYDAVIIDKNMPDLGGVETFQAYCFAHGGKPPVPFIILTADATEEAREHCKSAGIDLFLTKPVSLNKLRDTLSAIKDTCADQSTPVESVAGRNNPESDALPVLDEAEFEKLTNLAMGDETFIIEMIQHFETDAKNNLKELESCVAKHDLAGFRDYAHAMKGCALYVGLTKLSRISKDAEAIEEDDFRRCGVSQVQTISRATADAIQQLKNKSIALEKQAR